MYYIFSQDIHGDTIVGSRINLDFNDKKVKDIVDYTLLSVNQQEGSEVSYILSKIINASKQVLFFKIILKLFLYLNQ